MTATTATTATAITAPTPRLRGPLAVFSRVLEGAIALGAWRFDPERILAAVARSEGTDDLGPEPERFREALAVYCESVERDARPHGLGRFYLHRRVCQVAVRARLRVAPHVQAGAGPRRAPLIVCGLPRSGTTVLHRLLTLADDAAGIPFWQLVEPLPPKRGPDLRYAAAATNLRRLGALVPVSLDAQHVVRPDVADECGHLLRTAFVGGMPWQVPVTGWMEWSMQEDRGHAYRVWAAYLSQLEPPDRRLVLKDPYHAANLAEIHAVCPDAMVVQTHRDPVEVVPSFHKLCATVQSVLVPRFDLAQTVAMQTRWLEWILAENARARSTFPARQLVDVDYRSLVADPIATVARVHDAFGLPLTDAHVARMRAYLAENGQRRHGANPYDASAFGQRPEEIAERFAAYRERFGLATRASA